MNTPFVPLHVLLSVGRDAAYPVARRGDEILRWSAFHSTVCATAARLAALPQPRWALCCSDAFEFACGLFALLHAGKRIVVPPSFLPGTLRELSAEFDGIVAEAGLGIDLPLPRVSPEAGGALALPEPILSGAIIDLFTSGTSGQPKRVRKMASQLADEVAVLEAQWGGAVEGASIVASVPHHHIYGILFRVLWPLSAGRVFDTHLCAQPNELLQRLEASRTSVLVSSPAQLSRLPDLMDLEALRPRLCRIFSSGGPLAPASSLQWRRALGFSPTEVYGSTETGGIAWREHDIEPQGDCWSPLPSVCVGLTTEGALQVRSPFLGDDDWFATADAAQIFADGRFRLKGRLDRVVKIEEKRVSLVQMEDQLRRHPWVDDVAVVALPGERRVVLGAALVLSREGRCELERLGRRAAAAQLRRHLGDYHELLVLPRRWRFVPAMPYDERGKLTAAALQFLFGKQA